MRKPPLPVPPRGPVPARRPYGPPRLLEFGPVARRTLGGSGTMMENAMMQTMRFP
ncbi:MAG: hypothetical protein HUU06_02110 [Planctomycetaceae bacterium]|nr:hypothetical protein [Planctomycetaceae bacterium]